MIAEYCSAFYDRLLNGDSAFTAHNIAISAIGSDSDAFRLHSEESGHEVRIISPNGYTLHTNGIECLDEWKYTGTYEDDLCFFSEKVHEVTLSMLYYSNSSSCCCCNRYFLD